MSSAQLYVPDMFYLVRNTQLHVPHARAGGLAQRDLIRSDCRSLAVSIHTLTQTALPHSKGLTHVQVVFGDVHDTPVDSVSETRSESSRANMSFGEKICALGTQFREPLIAEAALIVHAVLEATIVGFAVRSLLDLAACLSQARPVSCPYRARVVVTPCRGACWERGATPLPSGSRSRCTRAQARKAFDQKHAPVGPWQPQRTHALTRTCLSGRVRAGHAAGRLFPLGRHRAAQVLCCL